MRSITHCPSCQTQFFVTEEQLNKHHGQVRCGQCLHVFDAKTQFLPPDEQPEVAQPATPLTSNQTPEAVNASFDSDALKAKFASNAQLNSYTSNGNVFLVEDQPYNPDNPSTTTKKRKN